ncbi:MAG: CPBP family intramembrane metalloprotease [Clostridiales bacterium]|jgi:membrane protease YdiL (CAAX protease family)|nr:CPBP family intramembrane metalloprotease [Clostridiales bacterium]
MDTPNRPNAFMFFLILFSFVGQLILGFALAFYSIMRDVAETGYLSPNVYDMAMPGMPIWLLIIISQVVFIGIPCVVYLIMHRGRIREILPLRRLGGKNFLMVTGMSIAIIPAVLLLSMITSTIFGNALEGMMDGLVDEGGLILVLILIPILPSIFEEVALRGIVFSGYTRVKIFTAAVVNGLFFGILHMNFNQFSYAFVIGFLMCYFIWYTKSLWAPVLCHFVINGINSLLGYIGMNLDLEGLQEAATDAAQGVNLTATQQLLFDFAVYGVIALLFVGIFIAIYIPFKRHNLARNEAEGVVTDTYAAAKAAGEPVPKALTWGFSATLGLGLFLMISMQWVI